MIYVYLHWFYLLIAQKKKTQVNFSVPLFLGMLFSVLAAMSGYFLAEKGGYDHSILDWHKYLGIGAAIGSGIVYYAYKRKKTDVSFSIIISIYIVLLSITGHYGGTLTHGKDFLTRSYKQNTPSKIADYSKADAFQDIVMPIINAKCLSCHNPEKSKGDLQLHNLNGWQKGGKNGSVIVPGDLNQSSLISRIFLPKSDEEHMPPDGKLQLTHQEKEFLTWWVSNMTKYNHTIAELNPDDKTITYLKSLQGDPFENIPPISQKDLDELEGINIDKLSKEEPWVQVSFAGEQSISTSQLKSLKRIKSNIRNINFAHSNVKNSDLKYLQKFDNLVQINLSKTDISDGGLKHLKGIMSLKNVNLYGTKVTNDGLESLLQNKEIEKIYAWQSEVSSEFANQMEIENPQLSIEMGVDPNSLGTPKLKEPTILSDRDLFSDSLKVTIKSDSKSSLLYYTLDSAEPDTNSILYTGPIILKETSVIKAIEVKEGWETSDASVRNFLNTKYEVQTIKLSTPPNEKYAANGEASLRDFKKGSVDFSAGNWLGYQEKGVTATLDLGEEKSISSISIGALLDGNSYIFLPIGFDITTSMDGKDYVPFAESNYPIPEHPEEARVKNFIIKGDTKSARYIKVKIRSQLKNPSWHQAPGAPCWIFIDEILVS